MNDKQPMTVFSDDNNSRASEANGPGLHSIRKRIDHCDREILRLLEERMELALRTKHLKPTVQDRKRENQILAQIRKGAARRALVRGEFMEKLYASILQESRKAQKQRRRLIGFQGEHGAYSEVAARGFDPGLVAIPCAEFLDVFAGVEDGNLDFGIVPVENSLGGTVTPVNELLLKTSLQVVAAVKLPIHHCLLALPESDYREIRIVVSHPQAISQCRRFLARNKLEPRPFYDTAGAAQALARGTFERTGVIASALAAELYDLEILKEHIEDNPANFTRFFVLAKKKIRPGDTGAGRAATCAIAFTTAHKAGTLFEVLRIFAEAGINLIRIESLPSPEDPAHFAFFLDFQPGSGGQDIEPVLARVGETTTLLKHLGCFEEVCP
jgi:prephenate dehydratase/chorismate mutase